MESGRSTQPAPASWSGHLRALRPDRWAFALAVATGLLHLLTARGYGIFRDELYYVACGAHLDWGYVDHPPLIALVARLVHEVLGDSLTALRLVPALAAFATVLLAAALARELGGGRAAQLLAGLATALAPVYLSLATILSMNALDLVLWSAALLAAARALSSGDGRLWIVFGALAGIGLQNKLSVLFLGFGVAAGLVLAREWSHLRDPRLWWGGAVAALIFAPHVAWQVAHGWPTAEFVRRATELKNVALSPLSFLGQQVLQMNPATLPLWASGLLFLLVGRSTRPYRALGWVYPVALLVMLTRNAKPYYLAPAYPLLFAAGAALLERAAAGRRWPAWTAAAVVGLSGAALAPLAKPLLPVDRYVAYRDALGLAPRTDERKELDRLPQFFADMHGWETLARSVAAVHRALPAEDRRQACVFGQNYGEAGAVDYYREAYALPPAISGHNSYWLWGPGTCSGEVLIVIGGERGDLEEAFAEVREAGRFDCEDCMPYEDDQVLYVARDLRPPLEAVWPQVKHFD